MITFVFLVLILIFINVCKIFPMIPEKADFFFFFFEYSSRFSWEEQMNEICDNGPGLIWQIATLCRKNTEHPIEQGQPTPKI